MIDLFFLNLKKIICFLLKKSRLSFGKKIICIKKKKFFEILSKVLLEKYNILNNREYLP